MTKQLTHDELLNHIKKHGITKAKLTHDWKGFKKGDEVWFGFNDEYNCVSSHNTLTEGKNKGKFNFDYEWWNSWEKHYPGNFIISDDTLPTATEVVNKDNPHIIKEKDGVRVGDRVIYEEDGKEYRGYVAAIDPGGYTRNSYILRLDNFNGNNGDWGWDKDWFPKSEKRQEKNCWWANREDFKLEKDELGQVVFGYDPAQENGDESCIVKARKFPDGTTIVEDVFNNSHTPSPKGEGIIKTIMTDVLEFAKDLTLSKDEKNLRAAGFKDHDLNWTNKAVTLALDKRAKSMGYKDCDSMRRKFGVNSEENRDISLLELVDLLTEYEKDLIDIANKYVAAQEKKK